jgi:hypothetical protein
MSTIAHTDKGLARSTRRRLIEKHARTGSIVLPAHFPAPSAGRIERAGEAFCAGTRRCGSVRPCDLASRPASTPRDQPDQPCCGDKTRSVNAVSLPVDQLLELLTPRTRKRKSPRPGSAAAPLETLQRNPLPHRRTLSTRSYNTGRGDDWYFAVRAIPR